LEGNRPCSGDQGRTLSGREIAGSRTARLVNQVFFEGLADEERIIEGLHATRIRLIADQENARSRAAQACIVTTFQLIARMGLAVELQIADRPLVAVVPPLRRPMLGEALLDLGADLLPGATVTDELERADASFAFGSTNAPPDAVRIAVRSLSCSLHRADEGPGSIISDECPLGALAAGAAAAPIALAMALPNIAAATGCHRATAPRAPAGPPVQVDLRAIFPGLEADRPLLGQVDAVSGGAITNAFLQTLLWLPDADATIRAIERERADLTNLNRYSQLRASDNRKRKTVVLANSSRGAVQVSGAEALFSSKMRKKLLPLAPTVVVGVDNVEARWWVQEEWPALLAIGATDNTSAVLTTHRPGEPCAGCAHPDPLPPLDEGDFMPTISFVSFWGGFMQALALASAPAPSRRVTIYPFALGGAYWWHAAELPEGARCAIDCDASKRRPT
jgi:hypothetical protein